MEKSLPLATTGPVHQLINQQHRSASRAISSVILSILLAFALYSKLTSWAPFAGPQRHDEAASSCKQPDPLFPSFGHDNQLQKAWEQLNSTEFRNASIKRLSGAVQVRTESFDDLGVIGEDPRWDVMYPFADYLETTFPRVHAEMTLEKINTHGLLFTLPGSNRALKPLILMAHQDVVPVEQSTVAAWTHPPFSGHYDGKFIWGRGSNDCKNTLIALMEAMELSLAAGFEPNRTIVFSFGFDEEISGRQGAGHLSKHLLERYGKNGVAAILDEGSGYETVWGSTFAKPGVAEKGYTDVHITIRYPGGHSSVPWDHTSIGMLSELITMIESDQYRINLADENPYLQQLQCGASHSPDFPHSLKKLLGKRESTASSIRTCAAKQDHLAQEAAKLGGLPIQYLMQTSQAVDIVSGGVKVNALPERVTATVNHRINVGEEPEFVYEKLSRLAETISSKYNLSLNAFNGVKEGPQSISLWHGETELRPAPVTPTDLDRNIPYTVLAGTTRAVFGEHVLVAPGIMTGNTDTRYYWDLSKHIFRFNPGYDAVTADTTSSNIHTVNEHVSVMNHLNAVKYFFTFVLNMDQAELDD